MSLKNIIYIDYEKVYSLSSQLFEGVVQSAVEEQASTLSNSDAVEVKTQTKSSNTSDTNKLSTVINPHDYHYLKFEKELFHRGLIKSISSGDFYPEEIESGQFVKIKCAIEINDYKKLKDTTKNFTDLGYAIHYVHKHDELENIDILISDKTAEPNVKKDLKILRDNLLEQIKESAMKNKKAFFDNLSIVLNYAYGDELEISQKINDYKFTSFLIRGFLKLTPEMLVKLYSRKTTREFTIVGIVTQSGKDTINNTDSERAMIDIRSAAWNMNDALANIESTFCKPTENEFFIEPIALYSEI